MDKNVEFLKNAIIGKKVGAISRSSKYVIKSVLKNLDGKNLKKVVEYGPGDGVLTLELLKIMSKDGKLLVVELDPNFIKSLSNIKDNRLVVVDGKMEDVAKKLSKYGFSDVDLVVSSIPFSLIKKDDREIVVKNSYNSIKKGGKFIIFHQYSTLMTKPILKFFKNIKTDFEPRNIFPCFIMTSEK